MSAPPRQRPEGDQSLASTLLFSFAAHVLVALAGVLTTPLYLNFLGAEGYGLVGFYLVMQGWIFLFDLGISPAVARQLSRYRAGALDAGDAGGLFRAAELAFLAVGIAAGVAFLLASDGLADHWLGGSTLPRGEAHDALRLMGTLLAVRWMGGLYQTALIGLEAQGVANAVSVIGVTARSGASIAVLMMVSKSPTVFFSVQAAATLAEALACRICLSRALPRPATGERHYPRWALLGQEWRFAATLALSGGIAIMVNQVDKLALSHVLPLAEFGRFSLVITVCSGISLIVLPLGQAFQPRFTALLAQGRRAEFFELYGVATALILVLAMAIAGTIAALPELVIFGWTGERHLAVHLAPTLSAYALGAGINAFLYAPFFLQFAQGSARLHLIGNLAFAVVWVPALVWAAVTHGALGAGLTWLLGNALFLVLWVPVVHRRWLSAHERSTIKWEPWRLAAVLGGLLALTRLIDTRYVERWEALGILGAASLSVAAVGALLSRDLRTYGLRLWAQRAGSGELRKVG